MISLDRLKSKDADICLILEGTYPFVSGGVANWVHELIRVFPKYRFAVIFLGTRAEDYHEPHYSLPKNLVHLEAHYLFEKPSPLPHKNSSIDKKTIKKIELMHDQFTPFLCGEITTIPELFELLADSEHVNETLFLRSKQAWQFIIKRYSERYSNQSFFDYFWGVRGLHRALWGFEKIVNNAPKFKVLHSASTGYAGFLGALLQKKQAIPYILTEHGIYTKERWMDLMRNYFFEETSKERNSFDSNDVLLTLWTRFFTMLGKISYCAADPIISLIEDYRQRQINDGALASRTKIISYGIDFDRYRFLDRKLNQAKPVIACIGRVVPIKDIKTFIRTCALIIEKIPAVEAWIVGSIKEDPEYVATCQNLIKILGLEHKVKMLGVQNMMEIYPKIDLLILSSISEASPFVMLESFAVGIPIVATNVGGCGELIYGKSPEDKSAGRAGRLVSIASPSAMAIAAIELLQDEVAWREAQLVGLARVTTYYSMKKLIENYGLIYQEAIDSIL